MRSLLIALLIILPSHAAQAGRFSAVIAAAASATRPGPSPAPGPVPSGVCDNCEGAGKVGDGTIFKICPVCNGTGKATTAAGVQPTPWLGVAAVLNELKPKPNEILLDPGCGGDARFLINAVRYFNVEKAIGVEIDPDLAQSARNVVEEAGLSDQIEIITGDSTKLDIEADVAVLYMWPEFLAAYKPKLEKLDRFVSYGFAVPGLATAKKKAGNGEMYVWRQPPVVTRVPIVKTSRKTVRLNKGSYCQVCGRHCGNPMAHMMQQQIVGYRDVAPASRGGHYETRKVGCKNGRCQTVQVWVPN